MLIRDTLYTGKTARDNLMSGIKKAADAVGSTMGTSGSNSLIEAIASPGHMATNDGATILDSMHFADPLEEMGRKILVEAVSRANKSSGDGSSTTCVLTAAILEEGQKYLGEASPMKIKSSLEACVPLIEESIKEQTRQIDISEVAPVAAISAEDEEIGQTIQEIYEQIGKDGIIHWDVSKTGKDYYTVGSGLTIEGATYASPYMCDADESGQNTNQIRLSKPQILVTRQAIKSAGEFEDIATALNKKAIKDLVVFCSDFDPLVIPDIVKTRAVQGFRIILVKMPVLWSDEWFEDLILATGATLVDPLVGLQIKDTLPANLGTVDNILITKTDTFIDGIADLSEHTKALKDAGDDESLVRAARLNTKTARYFVGAQSESALSYRRLKVEDAISAAYHAINGGIVAGGGIALYAAGLFLGRKTVGQKILYAAFQAPFNQIIKNSGIGNGKGAVFIDPPRAEGYDTRTGERVNMFEAQITDPAVVVLNAAKNAISVAAAVLTTNTVVLLPRQEYQFPKETLM